MRCRYGVRPSRAILGARKHTVALGPVAPRVRILRRLKVAPSMGVSAEGWAAVAVASWSVAVASCLKPDSSAW